MLSENVEVWGFGALGLGALVSVVLGVRSFMLADAFFSGAQEVRKGCLP